ncbi:MAG: WD40 repeat domain-containing protein, partial [Propionibacteriaceae bacterium]|nr:WD40 repeat domain-containing protein [Propionibacteriaceae bacterium]
MLATLVSVSLLGGLLATFPQAQTLSAAATTDLELSWVKTYGEYRANPKFFGMTSTSDDDIVIVGQSTLVFGADRPVDMGTVTKLDQAGSVLWNKSIGGTGTEALYSVTEVADGNYVAVGFASSTDLDLAGIKTVATLQDAMVAKLDRNGNTLWVKAFGGSTSDSFYSVAATADGGFVAAGSTYSPDGDFSVGNGSPDGIIAKFDKEGVLEWSRRVGGDHDDWLYSVAVAPDGGYVTVGSSQFYDGTGKDGIIVRFDKDGNVLWTTRVGGYMKSVVATNDGGFTAVGYAGPAGADVDDSDADDNHGNYDGFAVKLDAAGNKQWVKSIGGSEDDSFNAVVSTSTGTVIAVGASQSANGDIPTNKGSADAIITALDSEGSILWVKDIGGSGYDGFTSVAITPNGNVFAAGGSTSLDGDIHRGESEGSVIVAKCVEPVFETVEPSPTPTPTQTIPNVIEGSKEFKKAPVPKISGVKKVGRKLTAKAGTWSPAAQLTYNWYRNGKAIAGAYKSTYTLTAKDLGKKITVKVTGYRNNYAKTPKKSVATVKIGLGELILKPAPIISGTGKVGSTLTAKAGTWKPAVKKAYQWYRNGKAIKGATKSTYKLVKADAGKKITVKLTATKAGYKTVAKTSKPTKIAA